MRPADQYYFICKCLAMDDDPGLRQFVLSEVSKGNVPWEDFVWMGSNHFVLPALYSVFVRNGMLKLLPDDLAEHLSAIYTINEKRNKLIVEQSSRLIYMLNKEGIEPLFMKGAGYLLQHLYHNPGDRIMSDIDILVPENELIRAANALYTNGYFHPDQFSGEDFKKHHHLPGFEHKNEIATIEIHHSAFPGSFQRILTNADIFSDKKKTEGFDAWVMSVEHQMVVNFVHNQLVDDGYKYKNMMIKGLYDYYLLSRLDQQKKYSLSVKGYARAANTYSSFVSTSFNHPPSIIFTWNPLARRFKRIFDFLLNHPSISGFYQFVVVYRLRIPIILKTILTAPFSKQSRRYFNKKAGSSRALRSYLKKLKEEIKY